MPIVMSRAIFTRITEDVSKPHRSAITVKCGCIMRDVSKMKFSLRVILFLVTFLLFVERRKENK